MKNSEAEKLVCPFIVGAEGSLEINNFAVQNINCITGKCMAWGWATLGDDAQWCKSNNQQPKHDPNGYCKRLQND